MVLTPAQPAQLKTPAPPDAGEEAGKLELVYCWFLPLCTTSNNGDHAIFALHSVSFFTLSGPQREEGGSQTVIVLVLPWAYMETRM